MLGTACAAGAAPQQIERAQFKPRAVASGFDRPVFVTGAKGEAGRLYVVEQGGTIQVLDGGKRRSAPFLDIRNLVNSSGEEQGLLGLAFHPSYPKVKKLYVQYTARDGSTRVVEYRTNGNRASSPRTLFTSADPYGNHNGGMLAFGPNGRLYFTMGDGGAGGDPENRAQNPRSLFGKLLSLNVATKGVRIEALGLRNAWRFSFDRTNGDLYIGDVGQGAIEEVDYTPANSPGVENYGWDVYEGTTKFEDKPLGPGKLVMPVATYTHADGCSITGGYVYRGSNASLRGPLHLRRLLQRHHLELQDRRWQGVGLRREAFQIDERLARSARTTQVSSTRVSHGGTIYRLTPLNAICLTCATQFGESESPPDRCPICEDERQYVGLDGQRWTTLEELRAERRSDVREDAGYLGIGIEPEIGIGQRLLLVETDEGNVIWDMIPLVDDAAVEAVDRARPVRAIAISHPHYYSGMVEWSTALGGVPILLHEADRSGSCGRIRCDRALVGRRAGARSAA